MHQKFIKLSNDALFVSIFTDEHNMDIIENFISVLTSFKLNKIKGNVKICNSKLPKHSKFSAYQNVDLLYKLRINNIIYKINVELNNDRYNALMDRNVCYACKVHGSSMTNNTSKKKYKNITYFLQYNLNNFSCNTRYVKEKKQIGYPGNFAVSDKFTLFYVDMILASKTTLNKNIKLTKFCRALNSTSLEELKENMKGVFNDMATKRLVNVVENYNDDEDFVIQYEGEPTKTEFAMSSIYEEGKHDGLNQGIGLGYDNATDNIAAKLLKLGLSESLVEKATGLDRAKIHTLL